MAILNYGNQFKYVGYGYLDSKTTPVKTVSELETNAIALGSYYTPGMKVTVLSDEDFGTVDYFLNENFEWKRLIDFNKLSLSLIEEKNNINGKTNYICQLQYLNDVNKKVKLGDPVNLSFLIEEFENVNVFVKNAEIVLNDGKNNGLFIKFTYNNGNVFYSDITTLKPQTYSNGVGVLIGEGNVITIDENWFDSWFNTKIESINTSLTSLSKTIENISKSVNNNTTDISNLNGLLSKIRGVEYIKPGNNIKVESSEDGYLTISAEIPEFDTTELETRINKAENDILGNTKNIEILQEAFKNITPEGSGLSGDGVSIKTNEDGFLTVNLSEQELNVLKKNNDGLYVQGIEIILDDEKINDDETNY